MRKHSVRKWLHAILDLLPLFVIPVFAIYARNENAQFGYEVTQEVNKTVDFNQQVNLNNIGNGNLTNLTIDTDNGLIEFDTLYSYSNLQIRDVNLINGNKYYIGYNLSSDVSGASNQFFSIYKSTYLYQKYETYQANIVKYFSDVFTSPITDVATPPIYVWMQFGSVGHFSINNLRLFNLTQMFGEGNEPTKEEFENYFPNNFYPYTLSQEVVIEKYETITCNDTDIGSQMIYTLYNTVDKYFNMNNVFNMGAIWNWVNNTMFGGSAPLSAYIVYQIIAYELIMDIIFLLYSVMMFIVDFAEKGIDRFMGRAC